MKNAIFIHAANMSIDMFNKPNLGRCQEILDRIKLFIMESQIYNSIDSINLSYTGKEGLVLDVPKITYTYHGENVYQYEFPTLKLLQSYCKNNPNDNVLYIHTKGVRHGFNAPDLKLLNDSTTYHLYWNIIKHKESLKYLEEYDTCGAMLVPLYADIIPQLDGSSKILKIHDIPVYHYSNNFWWTTAKHINTLPSPDNYPRILDEPHQAEFWVCSSNPGGNYKCIHKLYEHWLHAPDFSKEKYMDNINILKF